MWESILHLVTPNPSFTLTLENYYIIPTNSAAITNILDLNVLGLQPSLFNDRSEARVIPKRNTKFAFKEMKMPYFY